MSLVLEVDRAEVGNHIRCDVVGRIAQLVHDLLGHHGLRDLPAGSLVLGHDKAAIRCSFDDGKPDVGQIECSAIR